MAPPWTCPFQNLYLQQSLMLFSNITFIFAHDAIMCIPQHNYQTVPAYFSFTYHSKCIHYHADWSIIIPLSYTIKKPIFKWGPFITGFRAVGQESTWCMDPKDFRNGLFHQTLKSLNNFHQWESDGSPLSWAAGGGYILYNVFGGQTPGSQTFTHNHGANKQCQVCKH